MLPHVTIVIPSYNRARLLRGAVAAALEQSHPKKTVMVVDDGSTDHTSEALAAFLSHPDFVHVRLERNVGTAQAKNVGIALARGEAVTFHDSDDLPHRDRVLRQARVLGSETTSAHPCLNWRLAGREPETRIQIGAVLTHHELILPDGASKEMYESMSESELEDMASTKWRENRNTRTVKTAAPLGPLKAATRPIDGPRQGI